MAGAACTGQGHGRGCRTAAGHGRGCLHGGRGHGRGCSVGCGRSSRDRCLDLGEFLEIRIECGLFVLLKLIAVHLGSIEILCGQLEPPAVEKPGSSFEIPDRRHWRGLACRRRWRRDRVIGRCTLRGRSPCADDQDESERTEPSQRDLLSPPRGQPPTSLMAALLGSPRRETLFGAYACTTRRCGMAASPSRTFGGIEMPGRGGAPRTGRSLGVGVCTPWAISGQGEW